METDRNPNQAIHWMAIRGDFVEEVDFIGTGSSGTYNNVSIIFDRVDHLNYSASFNELANTATNGFFRIPVRIQGRLVLSRQLLDLMKLAVPRLLSPAVL